MDTISSPLVYRIRKITTIVVLHLILLMVAASCVFPLLWMFSSSLKTQDTMFTDNSFIPQHPHWDNYVKAWTKGHFGMYFFNSLLYTVTVVTGIVIVSSLAAYAFSRLEFPFRDTIFFVFLAAMMIPLPGSFVALYALMMKLGFIKNYQNILDYIMPRIGYILCLINVGLSFSIFLLKTFFDKLPKDLEDAARIDGCGRVRIWWNVALPLAKPAIAVVIIFNSLNVWNEFILAFLFFHNDSLMPLQRGLTVFQGTYNTEYTLLMAGLTITVVPIILVYLFMQKFIIKGITQGAVVG